MGFLGSLFGNEVSHNSNLFSGFGAKNVEQLGLGAADPLGASLWGGITGQNFTPMVTQLGGETPAQYAQSDAQGVNTGPSRYMGSIADAIAEAEAGSYFGMGSFGGGDSSPSGVTQTPAISQNNGETPSPAQTITANPSTSSSSTNRNLAMMLMAMSNQGSDSRGQYSPLQGLAQIAGNTMALNMMRPQAKQPGQQQLSTTPPFSLGGPTQ